jgi:uncharacterized damage-inducible protein DinB
MPLALSADLLREHLLYTAWASQRLVHAIEQIPSDQLTRDFETADHSILGTLVHVFAADRVWLRRVGQEPASSFLTDADYDLRVLQIDWPLLYARWNEWAANLTDEGVSSSISYTDLKGNPHTSTVWEIVLHVVNHGTHHRGQVAGFLRTLGHKPPALDLIHYYREGRSHLEARK